MTDQIKDLQNQLEEAKLRAAIATQEAIVASKAKEALSASLAATEAKALEGKTTVDDNVAMESEILAYEQLEAIAKDIAEEITKKFSAIKSLVIHNDQIGQLLGDYQTFRLQANLIKRDYRAIREAAGQQTGPPALHFDPFTIVAATTTVKSVIDLLALFRSDTDIKGKIVTVEGAALISSIANHLGKKDVKVYNPAVYPIQPGQEPDGGEVHVEIKELTDAQREAKEAAASASQEIQAKLSLVDQSFDAFTNSLKQRDENTGQSRSANLLQAQALRKALGLDRGANTSAEARAAETTAAILFVKAVKAGGSNVVKRNLVAGSRLRHTGAAIVTYTLFHQDGQILASGTFNRHSGIRSFPEA